MTENEIGTKVLEAAIGVHRDLGPGLLEIVYEVTLARELSDLGLVVETDDRPVPPKAGGGLSLGADHRCLTTVWQRHRLFRVPGGGRTRSPGAHCSHTARLPHKIPVNCRNTWSAFIRITSSFAGCSEIPPRKKLLDACRCLQPERNALRALLYTG